MLSLVWLPVYRPMVNWVTGIRILHWLCSDGGFDSEGNFYPLPDISAETLEKVFAGKVLVMFINEKVISQDVAKKMLSWKHPRFSAHEERRLEAEDKDGLKSLAEYIVRAPVSADL